MPQLCLKHDIQKRKRARFLHHKGLIQLVREESKRSARNIGAPYLVDYISSESIVLLLVNSKNVLAPHTSGKLVRWCVRRATNRAGHRVLNRFGLNEIDLTFASEIQYDGQALDNWIASHDFKSQSIVYAGDYRNTLRGDIAAKLGSLIENPSAFFEWCDRQKGRSRFRNNPSLSSVALFFGIPVHRRGLIQQVAREIRSVGMV